MTGSKLPDGGPWDPETPPTRANVLLSDPCSGCGGTGAEDGVTGKGACSTCRGTGRRWPKANLAADVAKVAERLDHAATRHTIKIEATELPAVKRLAARSDLLDRIHDEAFPTDPYMLGRLHAEMERLGYAKDGT